MLGNKKGAEKSLVSRIFDTDNVSTKGIMRYALSDPQFIENGWTQLPVEKVISKMFIFRMRPAHPEFNWFDNNKHRKTMRYETGQKLAEFESDGRARWYYRNGRLALNYYETEDLNAKQRFVIYSSGDVDDRGRSYTITILATFDFLGNGVVFDHYGKIRLKYNQSKGVILDRRLGPVSHWKWHSLNDTTELQTILVDTYVAHKDSHIMSLGDQGAKKSKENSPSQNDVQAVEFDNFVRAKNKIQSLKYRLYDIKIKALKINEYFSLKILDQATIYLIFRDGLTHMKLNIGMVVDNSEILDTHTIDLGDDPSHTEILPETGKKEEIQLKIKNTQLLAREHVNRLTTSTDRAAAIDPRRLRQPNITYCKPKKPIGPNLYYNTRI